MAVAGLSESIRMRLSGLGFAGEYACTIRCAKGFATGNGLVAGVEVVSSPPSSLETGRHSKRSGGARWLFSFAAPKSGGDIGLGGGKAGLEGKEA